MRFLAPLAGLGLCILAAAGVTAAPATLYSDHDLAGTLWDTRSGRPVNDGVLYAEAAAADWVLLGEKHDNGEHHRLQARVVGALGRAGRAPAVVWEMAEPEHAEALRGARLEDVDDLGRALDWEARGWPPWEDYQPIAEQALVHGLPMMLGKPPRELVRRIARGDGPPAEMAERLNWSRRYPPPIEAELLEELARSHCGQLPERALASMVEVQRFWDAWMAESMREAAAQGEAAVLIAGSGHVREDRGVPWHLEGRTLTVAMVEVIAGRARATDYPAFNPRLYDYVWFTARVDDQDPCEAFRRPSPE